MNSLKYSEQITTYLGQQFSFSDEQIIVMLPDFISTLSSHMKRLEKALQESNLSPLITAGHTIKGAFLNLGLSECAELALQIEQGAQSADDSVDYSTLVVSLRQIVNDIINES